MTNPQATGPIVFLDPSLIVEPLGPKLVDGVPMFGVRTVPPQTNGSAERVSRLCREVGAAVVLTTTWRMGDVRDRLHRIGLRAAYHLDWTIDPMAADAATGIAEWLLDHGSPRHVVIDRPGAAPIDSVSLAVLPGQEISAAGVAALIAALA